MPIAGLTEVVLVIGFQIFTIFKFFILDAHQLSEQTMVPSSVIFAVVVISALAL
jgi:hypothetical protein